jgi:hypothetical protein
MWLMIGILEKKLKPRRRRSSIALRGAIARRTQLTLCGATIEAPAADRRDFSANKRIQHERRTQQGSGTSRSRSKVSSRRGHSPRQQRPRQGQGAFKPSPAARAECKRAFQDGAGQERPTEVRLCRRSRLLRRFPGGWAAPTRSKFTERHCATTRPEAAGLLID